MAATTLQEYFQPSGQQRALAAYARFAEGSSWSVPTKMTLYEISRAAFTPAVSDEEGFRAFDEIYRELRSNWKVARSPAPTDFWPARDVYDTIKREFSQFSWGGPITLPNLLASGQHNAVMLSLMAMGGIKSNKSYPIMAVSKFLHFYNPSLFPIYDTDVIWNKVFRRFRAEYDEFRVSAKLASRAGDVAFLRNYLCWASSLMASAHPGFMATFVNWLGDELPRRKFDALGRDMLGTLYATAFEFTAIGAAVAEEH